MLTLCATLPVLATEAPRPRAFSTYDSSNHPDSPVRTSSEASLLDTKCSNRWPYSTRSTSGITGEAKRKGKMAFRPRDLVSIPAPLRSLLLARLSPAHPSRLPLSPALPRQTRQASSTAKGSELIDLWNTSNTQLNPPPNPIAEPTFSAVGTPADIRAANAFFLAKRPTFLYSASSWRQHQVNYYVPEVCILGCSNAGKSTFINALLGENGLARSSSEPGSTRVMNAFAAGPVVKRQVAKNRAVKGAGKVDFLRGLILMDTPGYGYNSVKEWGQQIEEYLLRRTLLKGVVLLLRADVPLTNFDVEVLRFLADMRKRTSIILTRADRCGDGAWMRTAAERYDQISDVLRGGDAKGRGRFAGLELGDWTPEVVVTAAGMRDAGKLKKAEMKISPSKDSAGIGGARMAVLKLAGLVGEQDKEVAPEWVGETIAWDDIPIKGG